MADFLRDICSLHELETLSSPLAVRAAAARRHRPTPAWPREVGASTTTVTRVAHWLKHGEGGYRLVLERLAERGMSRPFRLALPSKGRMHEPALRLARDSRDRGRRRPAAR